MELPGHVSGGGHPDQLFRYAQPDREALADPATKEALRYRAALRRGVELLRKKPLSTATAVEVCRTLQGVNLDVRRVPGTKLLNEGYRILDLLFLVERRSCSIFRCST